jgi:three-Cys-motif partner protein
MGDKSAIEWTDATWNPVTGCTKVSPGCKHCYAERLATRLQSLGNPRYRNGFDVTLHPDQLTLPLRWRQPRRIFVNSMSDLFHESVPEEFIQQVFEVMVKAPWHIFQILTKRAQRLADLAPRVPWPPNVWQGVSVENAHYTWRIDHLRKVPAIVRFLSIEPLLGPIKTLPLESIHWVIVGGESGPQHRPVDPAWVRGIRDQCVAAGIPFFFKQWGGLTAKSRGRLLDGREWSEVPSKGSNAPLGLPGSTILLPSEGDLLRKDAVNNRHSGEAMQAQKHSRRRTPWDEAFFVDPRLTSKLKHLILKGYMNEFSHHLGSIRKTVYYVDGFAGPGIYQRKNGEIERGSPILIAEFAERLRATNGGFFLKCLNVEEKPEHYRQLKKATAVFTDQIVEKNYPASFTDALSDILRRIGNAPAFFFLDPFGTKGIPFRELLPLFSRTTRTEVFINFQTDGITKKAGWLPSLEHGDSKKRKQARSLTEHPVNLLALSREELSSWWAECVINGNGGTAAFEQRAVHRYLTLLRAPNTKFPFTKAFPVYYYRPDAPPGEDAPVCFHLVFATQHKKGLYEMNDCMVRALDHFYAEEYSHTFFPQFRELVEKPKDLGRLQQELLTQFRDRVFTIDEVKQRLMQDTAFLIKAGGYRDAVIQLKNTGRLEQLDAGRINNEMTRFRVVNNLPQPVPEQQPLPLC